MFVLLPITVYGQHSGRRIQHQVMVSYDNYFYGKYLVGACHGLSFGYTCNYLISKKYPFSIGLGSKLHWAKETDFIQATSGDYTYDLSYMSFEVPVVLGYTIKLNHIGVKPYVGVTNDFYLYRRLSPEIEDFNLARNMNLSKYQFGPLLGLQFNYKNYFIFGEYSYLITKSIADIAHKIKVGFGIDF